MRARGVLVMCVLAAACKGDPGPAKLVDRVPVVAGWEQLLGENERVPPILVLIQPDGSLAVADAPRGPSAWHVLSTKAPKTNGQPIDAELLGPLVRESAALGIDIEQRAKGAKMSADDLAPLRDDDELGHDDPPPPEPEEDDEDDEDEEEESGGTGTAMALEEGKMGPRRAEGTYNMRRNADGDPQLARRQAIDQARQAGVLGKLDDPHGSGGAFASLTDQTDSELPSRVTDVTGTRASDDDREAHALIVAAPTTKATAVIDVLSSVGSAFIAVSHQGKLRALRIGFGISGHRPHFGVEPSQTWVEVRVGADTLVVEAVPGKPTELPLAQGVLDVVALDRAFTEAKAKLGERKDVDVLIGPDTDLQRLVDVIVALDAAGAEVVSLGRIPAAGSPEAGKRGKPIVRAMVGQPMSVGDLDKAIIRRYIKRSIDDVKRCYERALLTSPDLQGTVQVQFFIAPDGTVASASASGLTDEVATCVAGVIKAIVFPKPAGGGGVQVNYPFFFRT